MAEIGEPLMWGQSGPSIAASDLGAPSVRIGVLGPLLVRTPSGDVFPQARRQRRLLTILAAQAALDRPITVEDMVDGLYGPHASERARRSLATELWRVRQVIGARAICTDSDGYRLDAAECRVDTVEFEQRLTVGRSRLRLDDHAGAERELALALRLWRADPLPEWREHPAGQAAATRLSELYTGGRVDHAEALIGMNRHADAVSILDAVAAAEPTREHAWAMLVEANLALGRQREARAAFDTARRTLAEYGVEIGSELDAARQLVGATPVHQVLTPAAADVPPLIGRVEEVARAMSRIGDSLDRGQFSLVLVTGEAGIGKTSLVDHVRFRLEVRPSPPTVLKVHCDQRAELPYGPITAALRSIRGPSDPILGSLAPIMSDLGVPRAAGLANGSPAHGKSALHDAVADAIEQSSADGLVLMMEDVHWAPETTLEALITIAARRPAVPLVLVLTIRDPAPVSSASAGRLAELRRRADPLIWLRGLDAAATAELLGPDLEAAELERLHRTTGGNPLYITHLRNLDVSDSDRRIPSLDDAVDDHLAAVSEPTAGVLKIAAVIGTRTDLRVLTAAAATSAPAISPVSVAEAVDEALGAGLLRREAGGDQFGWVHEVVCSRLYGSIPPVDRAGLHLAVARASERLIGRASVAISLIAHHYAASWPQGSTQTAVEWLTRAGDHATAQLGFDAAIGYYHRACDLITMDPAHEGGLVQADLLEREAVTLVALAGLHNGAEAQDDLNKARMLFFAVAGPDGEQDTTLRLRSALGVTRTFVGQPADETVLDDLADAVDTILDAGLGSQAVVGPLVTDALTQLRTQRPMQARALLARAVEAYPNFSGPLYTAAWAQQSVTERLTTARLLSRDPTADPLGAWIRLWVSEVAAGRRAIDDPPPNRPEAGTGDHRSQWELQAWEITAALAGGRYGRADRLLTAAAGRVASGRTVVDIVTRSSAVTGQRTRLTFLRTGSLPSDFTASPDLWLSSHPTISHPVIWSWGAYMAAATGQLDLAERTCDDLVDQYHDGLVPEGDLLPWACATATAAIAVRHHRASDLLRSVLSTHTGRFAIHTFTAYWGAVDHYLGRLALLAGDLDQATESLDKSVLGYRFTRAQAYEVQALNDLAVAHWRTGGHGRSRGEELRRESNALLHEIDPAGTPLGSWPPADD